MTKILDGKIVSEAIRQELALKAKEIRDNNGKVPHLAAILVGDDAASKTYVASKEKACRETGFDSSLYKYPHSISEKELLQAVEFISNDSEIDGLIVQLPLPAHISVEKVISLINPLKDVDGFHPENTGKLVNGKPRFIPATPLGIIELLKRNNVETDGQHCVVLGRSAIVGTPMSLLMSRKDYPGNATVTLCHTRTKNLKEICKSADIVIAAMGVPHFVTADFIKEGAVVVDVGIHRIPSDQTKSGFRLIGDVVFDEVSKKTSYITPVPGGVGPMTIAGLLLNTMKANQLSIE